MTGKDKDTASAAGTPQDEDDDKTHFLPQPDASVDEDDDKTQFIPRPDLEAEKSNTADEPTRILEEDKAAAGPKPDEPAPLPQPTTPDTKMGGGTILGVGTTINNNYRIEQVLKSGGMGEVYRGSEIGTGDPVAIKGILPELAEDEKAGLLFKREARTLRQLADDAIVRYYNYVHDRDLDQYFLVMEFIEGIPLSDHLGKHGRLPVPAVMTLLKRLAGGLSKAHSQSVVHRDLSPDNVMLAEGDVSQARLIDFGIAKSNVVTEGTMHGQFAGKFKYVAPEQLGDYGGEIGPATDIYGLALLVAAAALGKPLDMGASIVQAVQSRQSIPDLSGIPDVVQPILRHMLEPNPIKRPVSMDEVQRMLDNPALIPDVYREGLTLPPIDFTGRSAFPTPVATTPPQGLQVPMSTVTQTLQRSLPPQTMPPMDMPAEPEARGGNKALGLLVVAFLAVSGAAGFGAWQMGMIGDGPGNAAMEEEFDQITGIPQPQTNTRAGFLADFDAGRCTLLARVPSGQYAGMIEGFSESGDIFPGLPVAYEEKFGARPAVLPRQITSGQCAALEFSQVLQGRGREAPRIEMSSDEMQSGEAITARIGNIGAQSIWAALITPNSAVFNLTGRLSDPVGGERTLSFGLNLADDAEAAPQLVLIVASDRPLTRAATAADNTPAADLLPAILQEIAERGGAASATLSYVLLQPPADDDQDEGENE